MVHIMLCIWRSKESVTSMCMVEQPRFASFPAPVSNSSRGPTQSRISLTYLFSTMEAWDRTGKTRLGGRWALPKRSTATSAQQGQPWLQIDANEINVINHRFSPCQLLLFHRPVFSPTTPDFLLAFVGGLPLTRAAVFAVSPLGR